MDAARGCIVMHTLDVTKFKVHIVRDGNGVMLDPRRVDDAPVAAVIHYGCSLGSSKIDNTENDHGKRLAGICRSIPLGDVDRKKGMQSGRCGIGLGIRCPKLAVRS